MKGLEKILRPENYKIKKIGEGSENNKMIKIIYVMNIQVVFMIN